MSITIKCSNIVSFSNDTGQYVHCNQKIKVADERAGSTIACPKCGGSVDVVPEAPQDLAPKKDDHDDLFSDAALEQAIAPPPTLTGPPTSPLSPAPQRPQAPNPQTPAAQSPLFEQQSGGMPSQSPMANAPPGSGSLAPVPTAAPYTIRLQKKCLNCHAPLEPDMDVCPGCGYKQPPEPVVAETEKGFSGWFGSQLHEGTSRTTVYVFLALFVVGFTLLCGVLGSSLLGPLFFGLVCLAVFGGLISSAIGIVALAMRGKRENESTGEAVARVASPWALMLEIRRATFWRQFTPPFSKRLVISKKGSELGDNGLLQIENLPEVEVLDLEGTQVTDQGIKYLDGMPKLKYLVLLRTSVSAEAVRRLQNARPNLWIWH